MNPSEKSAEHPSRPRPELLAPAGDWDCVRAAICNGADAVYFGLDCGFNARYRAKNFGLDDLDELMRTLRLHGVRGYMTMNTLAFPSEMPELVPVIQRVAAAGVDAVLVQDFGVARLVHTVCPDLPIHASTQMSLTSAETIRVAADLGIERVVLARELSIAEIRKIHDATDLPLEAFIHGALCVAYSGQCLTSESLGGRSANRGHCAQACRLPYELVCDGEDRDLGDVRYLLSPQDLAGYAAIPDMIDAGVMSLKIEGRLKTAEYVANITGHYRRAIDRAVQGESTELSEQARQEMELSFSRGFAPGWLEGNDHKRLVPGLYSAKQGLAAGVVDDVRGDRIRLKLRCNIALGDGVSVQSKSDQGKFQGSRVYAIERAGQSVRSAHAGQVVWLAFGHGDLDFGAIDADDPVFKNDDPQLNRRLRQSFAGKQDDAGLSVDLAVHAASGQPLRLEARIGTAICEIVRSEKPLEKANKRPADAAMIREKLGQLGDTEFQLGDVRIEIQDQPMVPVSVLKSLRRDLVGRLRDRLTSPPVRRIQPDEGIELLKPWGQPRAAQNAGVEPVSGAPSLAVLCRTMDQVQAAMDSGVSLVYADFHQPRDYRHAVDAGRQRGVTVGLATVRMHKPGENALLNAVSKYQPDLILARNLAAIEHAGKVGIDCVADFSLNITNHRSAQWLCEQGVGRLTASYDLNRDQLKDLVDSVPADRLEVVVHQHMPLFHMEHCVFCSVLSPGTNKTNCGRPCDRHVVQLRDRVGALHPLQADIACRNTLYNASPQSGAEVVADLIRRGVGWYRVELLSQDAEDTRRVIRLYQDLLAGRVDGGNVWRTLQATNRVGVTRGTLEPKRNPLAIL
ncbi:U32 family peptidase [Crateriforma conspicua]|uniref:Putative protease YhbU n=1 Tax=Crateriforma conspicua TaxID=2527996 RepID=A0A5C6FRY4_9PLAN|nr:U32 family peptidase [Crateriforma conspicua]TWU62901.1 putative protease YhbU precursor [Crateriforma conspicua]